MSTSFCPFLGTRVLLHRNLGNQAGLIMLDTGGLSGSDPCYVDSFHAAREVVRVLLKDQDKEISGVDVVQMVCALFDKFLSERAKDVNETEVRIVD